MTNNKVAVYMRFGSLSIGFILPDEREIFKAHMNPTENKTAWIYCRSATGEDNDLQKQREAALHYAAAQNLMVIGETSDIGSGLRYDHPGLIKMLYAVESGIVSTVITKDISRIGRNTIKTLDIIENEIEAHGARLLCYTG